MPVGLKVPEKLLPIAGVRLAAIHSGIKSNSEIKDLVLIEMNEPANCATVFTTNKFCAAPVVVAREHLAENPSPRYLLINSGNANAGTGESGYQNAIESCRQLADLQGLDRNSVLPFSTGVIAAELPVEKISQALPALIGNLNSDAWLSAAEGIMTTDTLPKAFSREIIIDGAAVSITGIAKGSGMIKPDMATMLSYLATDARIDSVVLDNYLKQAVEVSFNSITVDGDTSTNDACVLIATGESGVSIPENHPVFSQALNELFQQLAQSIIRDAEGATKFVEIEVTGADSSEDAREVAYTVAHSPLVKTALFASDPNWGRILAAIGRARVASLDVGLINLYLGDICLLKNGLPDPNYDEVMGQEEMNKEEIKIIINLGEGSSGARIWTSDLSYDYVKINAEYRS
ncbi:MAG: bifunctional glutamate N-acetyltransferase/amino-acid acetyltransferase ArgJ [Gammaproteobacteria bacterium]|nr:bifunctional glutamate N-acetyltransferase/amino-acid acetyltransferase ArgJ [Gammaproteobacteria bacterium]